ncbi:MAG: hypothetical protein HeimC3_43930 [Candidatus Heimdallarchaeota archaeon LC_3]|nr:MAG: hypothetical protein HeimC3_43930 [Candidatus Heimdallarchaeota archaeon LC_3]
MEAYYFFFFISSKINSPTIVLKNNHFNNYVGLYDNKSGDYFILPEPLSALQTALAFPEKLYELEIENKAIHQFYSENYYLTTKLYNKYVNKEIEVFIFRIPDFKFIFNMNEISIIN